MKVNFNRIIIPSSKENILNLITKFIQCKICMNLLNDPYDCLCCNQTFCKLCIMNYIKANNKCPFSEFFDLNKKKESKKDIANNQNKKINNHHELLSKIKPSSSNFSKIIQSLKFYCQNSDKGCNCELNIEEISEHEKSCKYNAKKIKVELNNKNKNILNSISKNKKEKEKENIFNEKYHSFYSNNDNNDLLQDNISNQIKNQDSVVSFSGIKNFSENKEINQFYSNENSINNLSNAKLEKSIEEINQKLSYINNFIINNYNFKYINEDNIKSAKNYDKEISIFSKTENNETEEDKVFRKNSMTITNNFYDGSYINTVNNFANESINKENTCYNTIGSNVNRNQKVQNKMFSLQTNKNNINSKINNKTKDKKNLCKSLKSRKNTVNILFSQKGNKFLKLNKNKKNLKIKTEKHTIESSRDHILFKKQIVPNELATETPKLGGKTKSHTNIKDIKPFDLNLKLENDNKNKCLLWRNGQSSQNILNEDIFKGIKDLNCKILDIERLLQSNNSFKNQEYSIQNEDLLGDNQINDRIKGSISIKSSIKEIQNLKQLQIQKSNKDNINNNIKNIENSNEKKEKMNNLNGKKDEDEKQHNNEKLFKNIEELLGKNEDNIKNTLKEKFDTFKKFMEEQCIEDIKKIVLDTNFDITTLCTDKLDEFQKFINEKLNNLKF